METGHDLTEDSKTLLAKLYTNTGKLEDKHTNWQAELISVKLNNYFKLQATEVSQQRKCRSLEESLAQSVGRLAKLTTISSPP